MQELIREASVEERCCDEILVGAGTMEKAKALVAGQHFQTHAAFLQVILRLTQPPSLPSNDRSSSIGEHQLQSLYLSKYSVLAVTKAC